VLDELAPDEKSDAERELAPSVDVPDESDADPQLQRQFWLLVLVFNVALMAVSVGAMLAVFRGQWDTGTSLVAGGLVLAVYGVYKYRVYARADEPPESADDSNADAPGATAGGDAASDSTPIDEETSTDAGSLADLDARSRD
jgi:hypothetical protein